mgnify:CR=1 FL=1
MRLSARYSLASSLSVKAAYNTMHQYLHLLSNSTAISPTDVYQLSDHNIKPQSGSQVSLGLYKNLKSNTIETSIEGYYKKIDNYKKTKNKITKVKFFDKERFLICPKVLMAHLFFIISLSDFTVILWALTVASPGAVCLSTASGYYLAQPL